MRHGLGDTTKWRLWDRTLLFLIAIVLGDARLQQYAIRLIFGFDVYSGIFLQKEKNRELVKVRWSYGAITVGGSDAEVVMALCARQRMSAHREIARRAAQSIGRAIHGG